MPLVESEFRKTSVRANVVENRRLQMVFGAYDKAKRTAATDMRKAQAGYRHRLHLLRDRQRELLVSRSSPSGAAASLGRLVLHQLHIRQASSLSSSLSPSLERRRSSVAIGSEAKSAGPLSRRPSKTLSIWNEKQGDGESQNRERLPEIQHSDNEPHQAESIRETAEAGNGDIESDETNVASKALPPNKTAGHADRRVSLSSRSVDANQVPEVATQRDDSPQRQESSLSNRTSTELSKPKTPQSSSRSARTDGVHPFSALHRSNTSVTFGNAPDSVVSTKILTNPERPRRPNYKNKSAPTSKSHRDQVSLPSISAGRDVDSSQESAEERSYDQTEKRLETFHAMSEVGKYNHRQRSKLDLRPSTVWERLRGHSRSSNRSRPNSRSLDGRGQRSKQNPFNGMTGHLGEPWKQVRYFDEDEIEERGQFYDILVRHHLEREHTRFRNICFKIEEFCGDPTTEWERTKSGGWKRKTDRSEDDDDGLLDYYSLGVR